MAVVSIAVVIVVATAVVACWYNGHLSVISMVRVLLATHITHALFYHTFHLLSPILLSPPIIISLHLLPKCIDCIGRCNDSTLKMVRLSIIHPLRSSCCLISSSCSLFSTQSINNVAENKTKSHHSKLLRVCSSRNANPHFAAIESESEFFI